MGIFSLCMRALSMYQVSAKRERSENDVVFVSSKVVVVILLSFWGIFYFSERGKTLAFECAPVLRTIYSRL